MVAPVLETFTKANGTPWGGDLTWGAVVQGQPAVFNNQATATGVDVYNGQFLVADTTTGNHEGRVQAVTMTLNGSSVIGIKLRGNGIDEECYEFIRVGATTLGAFSVVLRRMNNVGAYVTLAGPTVVPRASGTTENLYFVANGSTLTCYLNGVQVLAATDTTLANTRKKGGLVIRSNGTNTTFADNFQLGDIGATVSSKAFAGTSDLGRNSAKTTSNWRKVNTGKSGTSNNAFAVLSSRVARMRARLPLATNARATFFSAQVEGFKVIRPILAKVKQSSSAKATITTGQKKFAVRMSQTFAGGGVFNPAILDVKAGVRGAEINLTSNVRAALGRNVGNGAKLFGADGAVASVRGAHNFFTVVVPLGAHELINVALTGTRVYFYSTVDTATNLRGADLTFLPPVYYFHCPINRTEDPPTLPHGHIGNRLFRHYKSRPCGRNVYIYSDNSVTENDPDGYSTLWKESDRTSSTNPNAPHVVHAFWGGHDAEHVTDEERALLQQAGYLVLTHP